MTGYNTAIGKLMEFDADLKVRFRSFHSLSPNMDVLIVNAPDHIKQQALSYVVEQYEDRSYGYIQWLTIFLRFTFQKLGFRNAKSWNILWGWGITCSELIYSYLWEICRLMEIEGGVMYRRHSPWYLVQLTLRYYNKNTFTPSDLEVLADIYTEQLRWKDERI
jgi:hypothetical protein